MAASPLMRLLSLSFIAFSRAGVLRVARNRIFKASGHRRNSLVRFSSAETGMASEQSGSSPLSGKKVLIIAPVWPESTTTAAGLRTLSLTRMLRKVDAEVTVASPARDPRGAVDALEASGVKTARIQPNDPAFDEFITELRPDVTIFDRFTMEEMFGWRVAEHSPDCLRVLDTQDLHFLRHHRQMIVEANPADDAEAWKTISPQEQSTSINLRSEKVTREIASIHRSDLTLLVSPFEKSLLSLRFNIDESRLTLAPFFYDSFPETYADPNDRSVDFISIGNFRHPPNVDSVMWLKDHLWPAIRARLKDPSRHKLHIYGAFPPEQIMRLSDKETNFIVQGPAPCQYKALRSHRCLLAPLRYGAGIKGKISDSWSVGTPVLTTPVGAEGMRPEEWGLEEKCEFGGEVSTSVKKFAEEAARMVENTDYWKEMSKKAQDCGKIMFGAARGEERVLYEIGEALESMVDRRKNDWLQALLFDDFHRSTEFKSRYIELKQRFRSLEGKTV